MWHNKFQNTCRLCLQETAKYRISENRIAIKIMTCLQLDVDTEDNMPQKVCSNCRILLEKIYVFRGKSYENDQALRKLVNANSSEVRHTEEFLQEDETSYSSHMPIVNVNVEVNESDENDFGDEETTMDDDLGDNSEHYSINIIDDSEMTGDPGSKPFIKQENQLNHNNKEQPEEFYQISTTVKTEKLDQVLESTMKSLGYDGQFTYSVSSISNDGMQTVKVQKSDGSIVNVAARLIGNWLRHPGDESDLLKTIMLPVTFPVKCGSDVHRLEAWISDNKLNYDKLIYVLRRRFAASPDPFSALKNLFLYSIAFDFVHPSGHRKGNMTLISDMRVFTEALEDVLMGCPNVDLKQLWKDYFRNARNWIRTRRSREKTRNTFSSLK